MRDRLLTILAVPVLAFPLMVIAAGGDLGIVWHQLTGLWNTPMVATAHARSASPAVVLNNVTITNNTADFDNNGSGDGGGINNISGTVFFRNTIIAGNFDASSEPDCKGRLFSFDFNLVGIVSSGCNIVGTTTNNETGPAGLGPLANNGGFTETHALLSGSQAIDAGNNITGCTDNQGNPITRDQRGAPRMFPDNPRCDIGAYEFESFLPPGALCTAVSQCFTNACVNGVCTTAPLAPLLSRAALGGLAAILAVVGLLALRRQQRAL